MTPQRCLIATGWSLHLPGAPPGPALAGWFGRPMGAWAYESQVPPDGAAALLGRKGLISVEPATRLALCAVHRALRLPPGVRPEKSISPEIAVVACGGLGNAETVVRTVRTVAREGGRAVSALDAPNISNNVIASTVALWFGFGGPNLMVCSGTTSGLDGLRLAAVLLRAHRAERVVLVGAEPADEVASALHTTCGAGRPLGAGAACVVLEAGVFSDRPEETPASSGHVLVRAAPRSEGPPPSIVLGQDGTYPASPGGGHDYYAAQGVITLALAAHLVRDEGFDAVGVCCEGEDGSRTALVGTAAAPGGGRPTVTRAGREPV